MGRYCTERKAIWVVDGWSGWSNAASVGAANAEGVVGGWCGGLMSNCQQLQPCN